jgi:hypothetical protein
MNGVSECMFCIVQCEINVYACMFVVVVGDDMLCDA